ncbi:MAG TPA: hypothetical protein VGG18_13295 [Granulicella sp.]
MPIEIVNGQALLSASPISINFINPITQYIVGINAFNLTYSGGKAHDVESITVKITASKSGTNSLSVSLTGTNMQDASGNTIDPSSSSVGISVIAITGETSPTGITLGSSSSLSSGGSWTIVLDAPSVTQASFLSGFNMSYYTDEANNIQSVDVSSVTGATTGKTLDSFLFAYMQDNGKNHSVTQTVSAGLLAASTSDAGFLCQTVYKQQTNQTITVDFSDQLEDTQRLTSAAVFITEFTVAYPFFEANQVNTIGAGLVSGTGSIVVALPQISSDGKSVLCSGAEAIMHDNGNHYQASSLSWVNLLVVALPS